MACYYLQIVKLQQCYRWRTSAITYVCFDLGVPQQNVVDLLHNIKI